MKNPQNHNPIRYQYSISSRTVPIQMKESVGEVVNELKPAMVMVAVQTVFACVNVFLKLATNDGMSAAIILAYRFLFATASTVPFALICERKSRPTLTWKIVLQSFLCALFGATLAQRLYLESLILTSATFTQSMFNLVPAITFVMGVAIGLETLAIKTPAGKAKVAGTVIGISGALVLTLYRGAEVNIWSSPVNLLNKSQHHMKAAHGDGGSRNRVVGALLALSSGTSYSLWLILQTHMNKCYPSHYSSTALFSVMAAVQTVSAAMFTERDWSRWQLGWNIRLLTVAFAGIMGTGLLVAVISWCVNKRGPLFVSVFTPLQLVLVAIAGSLLLGEKLHIGSVIGAILIVCGLYVVVWGKNVELKTRTQLLPSKSSDNNDAIHITTSPWRGNDDDSVLSLNELMNGLPDKKEDTCEKNQPAGAGDSLQGA